FIERPISPLWLVLQVNLGKCQSHGLRSRLAAGVTEGDPSDNNVVHLDDEVLGLAFARLPLCDGGVFQVSPRPARLKKPRGCLVDIMKDGKILKGSPTGAATAAASNAPGICDTPGERQHLDLVLVFDIDGFPFDVSNLCKDVGWHRDTSSDRRLDRLRNTLE